MFNLWPNVLTMIILSSLLSVLSFPQTAGAESFHKNEADFASGTGNTIFVVTGILLPLFTDKDEGLEHSLRILDSAISADLITEGLKRLTHEQRPDDSDFRSFPSGHATVAFAIATAEAEFHPKRAVVWYLGASIIAESRVELKKHYVHDVLAGAACGYFTAEWELHNPHGLLLFPFIDPDNHSAGLQVAMSF
jgi:membrane-associated phospholipid phosphatase